MNKIIKFFMKRRAFCSIFVTILIFVCISVFSLGTLHYQNSTRKLTDEYKSNNVILLEQAKTAVDIIINTVLYTTNQIYNDNNFIGLIRKGKELNIKEKGDILSRLAQLKDSSQYIDSVVLFLPNENFVFCTDYGFTLLDGYPDKEFIMQNASQNYGMRLISSRNILKAINQQISKQKVITLLKMVSYTSSRNAVLMVNFDTKKIYDSIINKMNVNIDTEMFAIGQDNNIILINEGSKIVSKIMETKRYEDLIHTRNKVTEITLNYKKYWITSVLSETLNADFVWIFSYEQLNNTITTVRNISIINSVIILILLLAIATFIAQKTSKPVDELLNLELMQKLPSNKSKNIFNALSSHVKDIINSNFQLQDKVNRMLPVYKENFLYGLLNKNDLNRDEIYKRLGEYNIEFKHKIFQVIIIEILNLYELSEKNINLRALKFTITESMDVALKDNNLLAFKVNIDDRRVALILSFGEKDWNEHKTQITLFCKSISEYVLSELGIGLTFSVSSGSKRIEELNVLFNESKKALKYRLLRDDSSIIFAEDIILGKNNIEKNDQNIKDKIKSFLLTGDEILAQKFISDVLQKHSNKKNITAMDFQYKILNIADALFSLTAETDMDLLDVEYKGRGLFEILEEIKTVNDAEKFFKLLISKIFENSKTGNFNIELHYYEKIMEYLDKHYLEDISIDILSANINISSSYIFKILRERQNDTFTEYITKKRMEKACELLKANLRIKDIAEKVGYSSANYFIQVFKKTKGCTPNNYKKIHF